MSKWVVKNKYCSFLVCKIKVQNCLRSSSHLIFLFYNIRLTDSNVCIAFSQVRNVVSRQMIIDAKISNSAYALVMSRIIRRSIFNDQ